MEKKKLKKKPLIITVVLSGVNLIHLTPDTAVSFNEVMKPYSIRIW